MKVEAAPPAPPGPERTAGRRQLDAARANEAASAGAKADGGIAGNAPAETKEKDKAREDRPALQKSVAAAAGGAAAARAEEEAGPSGSAGGGAEVKLSSEFIQALPILAESRPALRAEPYSVRLLARDTMRVESGAYACSVTLLPEDARLLADQYAAIRPAPAAPAAQALRADAPAAARPPAEGGTPSAASKPSSADAGVTAVEVTPEARALILLLVRERYRAALEERCGPLPR